MNTPTLLAFILAVFLSFQIGKYLFKYLNWWGVLPATILGFGLVVLLTHFIREGFGRPKSKPPGS
jgi:hypothetical protein